MASPTVEGILETAIYVADVEGAARFYERVFGFERLYSDDRLCALNVADRNVLLIFRVGASIDDMPLPGGVIPGHDGRGTTHFAFAVTRESVQPWRERLAEINVQIESEVTWALGGVSLYFRDPDGHLVELATPGIWRIY